MSYMYTYIKCNLNLYIDYYNITIIGNINKCTYYFY